MLKLNISIIGAGNIGWHLAQNLNKKGCKILQVFSRNFENASLLAKKVHAISINSLSEIDKSADLILICVKDSAIKEVIAKIDFQPKLIAHTAGSISINALSGFNNYGVFYPLQSFSKTAELDIKTVPFCIEANSQSNKNTLLTVAKNLSEQVFEISSEQRMQCHIAEVFANNFANNMFSIAEQILKNNQIPFDILKPIILETAKKVQTISPIMAQTGPALRNDKNTIKQHIELLQSPQLKKIYSFVSQNILELNRHYS